MERFTLVAVQLLFKRWIHFCDRWEIDYFYSDEVRVLEILIELHETNLGYSSINGARSAPSSFLVNSVSQLPIGVSVLVKKFIKGIFNIRPPMLRFAAIWDVKIVLDSLSNYGSVSKLSLKQMT